MALHVTLCPSMSLYVPLCHNGYGTLQMDGDGDTLDTNRKARYWAGLFESTALTTGATA